MLMGKLNVRLDCQHSRRSLSVVRLLNIQEENTVTASPPPAVREEVFRTASASAVRKEEHQLFTTASRLQEERHGIKENIATQGLQQRRGLNEKLKTRSGASYRHKRETSFLTHLATIQETLNKEETKIDFTRRAARRSRFSLEKNRVRQKSSNRVLRVMDVDRVPVDLLHRLFLSQLVKWVPSEQCISLASRISRCRDSNNQTMHRNLHNDVIRLVGCQIAPDIVALLPRVQTTIAIPFMIDYIRRFGQFSKQFIAAAVERSLEKRLFDFVRYATKPKRIPLFIQRPTSLLAHVQLMRDSTAKRLLLYNLDPTPLHRQNLVALGCPMPQLPIHQIGPNQDTTAPLAMRATEKMSQFEDLETYLTKRPKLGVENVTQLSAPLVAKINMATQDPLCSEWGALLQRAHEELSESQHQLKRSLENGCKEQPPSSSRSSEKPSLSSAAAAAVHGQLSPPCCGSQPHEKRTETGQGAASNLVGASTTALSWEVPKEKSFRPVKSLKDSAIRLQQVAVATSRPTVTTAVPCFPLQQQHPVRLVEGIKRTIENDPETLIHSTVTQTLLEAKKWKRRPLFRASKRLASIEELKRPAIEPVPDSHALTIYENEAARRWTEDYHTPPWWRNRKPLRFFVHNKRRYLLTRDGWTRMGKDKSRLDGKSEERHGEGEDADTAHSPRSSLKYPRGQPRLDKSPGEKEEKEEHRKRKAKGRKTRAELLVKATQMLDMQ